MVPSLLVLALLAPVAAPSPSPRPAPPRPGLSWAEADSLGEKLEALGKRGTGAGPPSPRTVLVTQGELNSYLNLALGPRMPEGVSDVEVRLEPGRLAATAIVDLDRVKAATGSTGPLNPISYLGGRVPVEASGRFPNQDGFGTIEVEEVRLGGFSLPAAVLRQMVASATRTPGNPQGFDIQAPFRLPYSVKRVRLQAGRVMLEP